MKRIGKTDFTPTNLFEHRYFDADIPYSLRWSTYPNNHIVPLHYAETLEILLMKDIAGKIMIQGEQYPMKGNMVFVIPPYAMHSMTVTGGSGVQFCFKLSFREMDRYINLEKLLSSNGCELNQLMHVCPDYEGIWKVFKDIIAFDNNLFARMRCILSLFEILQNHKYDPDDLNKSLRSIDNATLKRLVDWTFSNYNRKITIDEAAKQALLSKSYFCRWFKTITNMTYLNYLNSIRISQACSFLMDGHSVTDTCYACGFENPSYFIQIFKRIKGCTPAIYSKQKNAIQIPIE